jgi:hypothetical protein
MRDSAGKEERNDFVDSDARIGLAVEGKGLILLSILTLWRMGKGLVLLPILALLLWGGGND